MISRNLTALTKISIFTPGQAIPVGASLGDTLRIQRPPAALRAPVLRAPAVAGEPSGSMLLAQDTLTAQASQLRVPRGTAVR
jgi:hypothetical protein